MSALDPFAFGGTQDDAELIALEQELLATKAKLGAPDISDDHSSLLASEWRELERRINLTKPKTTIGVAVKLRQSLRVAEDDLDMEDDDIACLQQAVAFMESGPVAVLEESRELSVAELRLMHLLADSVPQYRWAKRFIPPVPPETPEELAERERLHLLWRSQGPAAEHFPVPE